MRNAPMRKILPIALAMAFLAGAALAQAPARRPAFSVSGGLLFDSDEPGLVQWGLLLSVGFRLGRHFFLSPEAMFAGSTGHSVFYPGLILTYAGRTWFTGAGLVQPVEMYGQSETSLAAKFVLGFTGRSYAVTGFFMGSLKNGGDRSLFDHYRTGVTFGFFF